MSLVIKTTPILYSFDKINVNILPVEELFSLIMVNKKKFYLWNGEKWIVIKVFNKNENCQKIEMSHIILKNSCLTININ